MRTCQTCVHWRREQRKAVGACQCPKFVDINKADRTPKDGLGYWGYPQFAWFNTGPSFGCVHHVEREAGR